jgi:hypothetical protein
MANLDDEFDHNENQLIAWVHADLNRFVNPSALLRDYRVTRSSSDNRLRGRLFLWTSKNRYGISFTYKYLGCIAISRRWRAGEDWHRGRDLSDGSFSRETWERILRDIICYELEEPAKQRPPITETKIPTET